MNEYRYFTIVYANGSTAWWAGTQEDFDKIFLPKVPIEILTYYCDKTEERAIDRFLKVKNI